MTNCPCPNFWRGKHVLLTGHTGFKGAWLSLWLQRLGATVFGLGLVPESEPNLYTLLDGVTERESFVDIRNAKETGEVIKEINPHIVFHLAAQSLVGTGYREPIWTIETNVLGTVNILEGLRHVDRIRALVAVTTDKVYRDRDLTVPFTESDRLGGFDPYSSSKAACEILITSYKDAYLERNGVAVATARSGNVIGGGDWAADRLIPDAIRAWCSGKVLKVRNPKTVRPWQHVLEPLAGYLRLAERIWSDPELGGAYNFGPDSDAAASVEFVLAKASKAFDGASYIVEESADNWHESDWLMLDSSKACNALGVSPKWSLEQAISRTISWYLQQFQGSDARTLCVADISAFESCTEQNCRPT